MFKHLKKLLTAFYKKLSDKQIMAFEAIDIALMMIRATIKSATQSAIKSNIQQK